MKAPFALGVELHVGRASTKIHFTMINILYKVDWPQKFIIKPRFGGTDVCKLYFKGKIEFYQIKSIDLYINKIFNKSRKLSDIRLL